MKTKTILLITIAILTITANVKAQNIPSYIPTNGLVGWWPFNGNANDESGNGNDGTVNGATLTNDRFGNSSSAYDFDGVNQFIQGVYSNFPIGNSARSLSGWVLLPQPNNLYPTQFIASWGLGTASQSSANQGFGIWLNLPNTVALWQSFGSSQQNEVYNQASLTQNQYMHIVVTIDIDGNFVFYLNSIPLYSNIITGMNTIANDNIFRIGRSTHTNSDGWAGYFLGKIDDLAIWNRALTQEEITALYTASNNNETSNTTANVPGAISYQAVARDAQGMPLADANLQVQFTLIADSLSGTAEYVETHTLFTNSLGLFTTAFGAGTPVSNTFGNINWTAGNKFVNVQIDAGNGWMDMGTQQLLSTPYSLYSAKAGEIKNPGLPVFANNAAALAGGLVAGDMYRTSAGVLMVVY